jgi:hypothetical protein
MSLQTLELLPRGNSGWGSGCLTFGASTTLLLGPNGSGKTPLMRALAYCLGHPVELPPLLSERCRAVIIAMLTDDGRYLVERKLQPGVEVTVTDPLGATRTLRDERALSEWILPKMGVSLRVLSGKSGEKVPPYMSIVGPMFLVDQDAGWTNSYVPFESHQFIKDQREEVVRWLLDLPVRNRPCDKSELQAAKIVLGGIQEQIAFKRRALEGLHRELGEDGAPGAAQRLEERRATLESELQRALSFLESVSQVESAQDVRVRKAIERRDEIAFRLKNAKRRKAQLTQVQAEVGAELSAVEQNEVAAEAFRRLCGNEDCKFFRNPDESYGRRVLYLRDQLKDFEFSTGETERELAVLDQQLEAEEAAIRQTMEEKRLSLERTDAGAAVDGVQTMSRELADLRVRIDRMERTSRAAQQLDVLINKEGRAAEDVAGLRPARGARKDNTRLLDARQHLAAAFSGWLLALRTPNVSVDILFDEELRLIVDGERFSSRSSHSGSTRTRLVLAYHASLLETSMAMGGAHPRLLVLDAPRQHELHATHLRSYIKRFYEMFGKEKRPVQLVFTAKHREVVPVGQVDRLWEPQFPFAGERKFLGPPAVSPPSANDGSGQADA